MSFYGLHMSSDAQAAYNDPLHGLWRSPALLARQSGVSVSAARAALSSASPSTMQGVRRSGRFAPSGGPAGSYGADVVYLRDYAGHNDRVIALFTVLHLTRRYAYVRPLTQTSAAHAAAAMTDVLAEIQTSGQPAVVELWTDGGSEFKGVFAQLCVDANISQRVAEARTHYRLTRVDRFHRTLRALIGRHQQATGSPRYVDVLNDLVRNYNTHPHRALAGLSPAQMTDAHERDVRALDLARALRRRRETDARAIVPGTSVMYQANAMDAFAKGERPRWAGPADVVARVGPHAFEVDTPAGEVRIFPAYAVRKVAAAPAAPVAMVAAVRRSVRATAAAEREVRGLRPEPERERSARSTRGQRPARFGE